MNCIYLPLKYNLTTNFSDDELQDIDETRTKILDRKRRDISAQNDKVTDDATEKTIEEESKIEKAIEKRSNKDESVKSSFDEVSEILDESENNDDVQRRTRQLRPSIISSPWRVSSGNNYRSLDFAPSQQNSFGSNFNNFPTATAGFLFKNDGRFYPTTSLKASNSFSPVISTYSGGNKNKYQSFASFAESSEGAQDPSAKYKHSSKIPGQSSSLLPLLFPFDNYKSKTKLTASEPIQNQDNYSYFHIGPKTNSQSHPQSDQKTFVFPVTSLPSSTPRSPFASYKSIGGFFNNNQQPSNNFLPLKPISHSTPAPIYEGSKSASSYESRFTTPSTPKATSPSYHSNTFLNNLNFNSSPSPTVFGFGDIDSKHNHKVVEITTKKSNFQQYPIPSSTPKYIQSYTTPNQLFDFDKFVAGIRESQRLQSGQKLAGINNFVTQTKNKTQIYSSNPSTNIRYQSYPSSSTTAPPVDYYYDDEEEIASVNNGGNLSKIKTQSAKPSINNYNSYQVLNKKPQLINSNAATIDDDEYYYDDDEDDEEEFQYRPPPINKSKYMPMTETMAPRPINITTIRPYYVSGQTFSTPPPPPSTSSIPSFITFPDDVFQSIRPFTSPKPQVIYVNKNPSKYNIIKNHQETTTTPSTTSTTTQRPTTRKNKIKILTKSTTKKTTIVTQPSTTLSTTTSKPTRLTTRRKTYTLRPDRGNLKFKVSTKRPDLTINRLEIDENLPNR